MGKGLNPADAYRKEQKKKEIKKSKKEREKVREVANLLNNPEQIENEIRRVQKESDANKLDKGLKDRLKELKAMKIVADRKQRAKGVGASSDGQERTSSAAPPAPAPRKPEESVYYHPVFNPTGAPPPGQPPMYRPQGPVDGAGTVPPPPPPPPRMPPSVPGMQPGVTGAPFLRGVPPNGRSAPLPVGGMHGVPLPPPRPPGNISSAPPVPMGGYLPQSSGYPHQTPGAQPSRMPAHHAPRQRSQVPVVDPLDPAAEGYTERYVHPSNGSSTTATSQPPSAEKDEQHLEVVSGPQLPEHSPVVSVQQPVETSTTTPSPMPAPTSGTEGGTVDLAELMRRRREVVHEDKVASVEPSPSTSVGPTVDLAELMRRRRQAVSEDSTAPSAALPEGPVLGPSGPPVGPLAGSYPTVGPQVPSGETYGPHTDQYPSVGPSIGPSVPSSSDSEAGRSQNESSGYTGVDVPVPVGVKKVQGPKLVKVGAELVSFVPAALRVKRQQQEASKQSTAATLAKFRRVETSTDDKVRAPGAQPRGESTNSGKKEARTTSTDNSASVDDVYESFMAEINELGGFD